MINSFWIKKNKYGFVYFNEILYHIFRNCYYQKIHLKETNENP